MWMDVDGCGWMWMDVDGCGWMWMDVITHKHVHPFQHQSAPPMAGRSDLHVT
jgi:hypothetical protein